MTATDAASDAGSDDYQHWADDSSYISAPASSVAGHDTHNGLRSHTYYSTLPVPTKPGSPKYAPPMPVEPQMIYYAQPQNFAYPGVSQYTFAPQQQQIQTFPFHSPVPQAPAPPGYYASPAPAYYGYGVGGAQQQQQQPPVIPAPGGGYYVFQPAYTAPAPAPAPAPAVVKAAKGPADNVWVGRTKAQVEEDNMVIAKREGAHEKRKVQPVGVADDQMMWCVEADESHVLRTFMDIKELKGEWKKDPRWEDSYFFVREKEEKVDEKMEKEEQPKKKEKKTKKKKAED